MKAKIVPLGCIDDIDKGFSIILTPENKKEEKLLYGKHYAISSTQESLIEEITKEVAINIKFI